MEATPHIDCVRLADDLRQRLPDADITVETINPDYGSWEMAVRRRGRWINISWGPLSGFGATDMDNLREDNNPFASHDWPLDSADAAIEFVFLVLDLGVARTTES